jgi:hypothetical protein
MIEYYFKKFFILSIPNFNFGKKMIELCTLFFHLYFSIIILKK